MSGVIALGLSLGALAAVALAAEPAIVLEAECDRRYYREGGDNEIYVQARVRTTGGGDDATADPVRNIAFVLDRSGSMDGIRMQALQAAVSAALDTLADRDVVSVVLFGSEVEAVVEAQRCDQARARFARLGPIVAEGGAALYDGVSQGAAQVRRHAAPNTVNQILIVTDGAPTKGPRERDDFARLAATLAREGMSVSAIGLGDEFDEDLLAALAREGGGRFLFADAPEKLEGAVRAEVAPRREVVATDAVLSIEFRNIVTDVTAHGSRPATVERSIVTRSFAQLTAGQDVQLLASAVLEGYRTMTVQRDFARARLRYTDAATGEVRELATTVTVRFSTNSSDLVESINIQVYRAAVAAMVSDGMQDAIEQVDAGDFRRALRELRRVRGRTRDANYQVDDPEIAAMVARLDAYIADVQARGMSVLDRKVLRSGLYNEFDLPTAAEEAEKGKP